MLASSTPVRRFFNFAKTRHLDICGGERASGEKHTRQYPESVGCYGISVLGLVTAAAAGHHNRADCSRPRVAAAGVAACGGAKRSTRTNS